MPPFYFASLRGAKRRSNPSIRYAATWIGLFRFARNDGVRSDLAIYNYCRFCPLGAAAAAGGLAGLAGGGAASAAGGIVAATEDHPARIAVEIVHRS